jgi:hypothetical protein
MPKKTIPVKKEDLRPGDVVKGTGIKIPVQSDYRNDNSFRDFDSYRLQTVEGYLVEREVNSRLNVTRLLSHEASRYGGIGKMIAMMTDEYEALNGDIERMVIVTEGDTYTMGTKIALDGWTRK